jgi:hypothetical protein
MERAELNSTFVGSNSLTGRFEETQNYHAPLENCPALSVFTIMTELSRVPLSLSLLMSYI